MGSELEVIDVEPDASERLPENPPYGYVDVFSTATGDLLPLLTYEVRQEVVTIGREHSSDIRLNVLQISRYQGSFTVHPPTEGEPLKVVFRTTTNKQGTRLMNRKMTLNQEYEITTRRNSITILIFKLFWRQYDPENPSGKLDETTPIITLSPLTKNPEETPFLTPLLVGYGGSNSAESWKSEPKLKTKPKTKSVGAGDLRRVALTNVLKKAEATPVPTKDRTNVSKKLSKRESSKKVEEPPTTLSEIAPKASPAQKRPGSAVEKKAEATSVATEDETNGLVEIQELEPPMPEVPLVQIQELDPPAAVTEVSAVENKNVERPMSEVQEGELEELETSVPEVLEVGIEELEPPMSQAPPMDNQEVEPPMPQVPPMDKQELESPMSEVPAVGNLEVEPPMSEVQEGELEELEPPTAEVSEGEIEELESPVSEVREGEVEELEPPTAAVSEGEIEELEPPVSEVPAMEIEGNEPPEAEVPELEIDGNEPPTAEVPELEIEGNEPPTAVTEVPAVGNLEVEPPMSEVQEGELEELELPTAEVSEGEIDELESSVPEVLEVGIEELEPPMSQVPPMDKQEVEPPMSQVPPMDKQEVEPPMSQVPPMDKQEGEPPMSQVAPMDNQEEKIPKKREVTNKNVDFPMVVIGIEEEVEPPMVSDVPPGKIEEVEPQLVTDIPPAENEEEINDSRKGRKRGQPKKVEPPAVSKVRPEIPGSRNTRSKLDAPTHVSEVEGVEDTKISKKREVTKKKVEPPMTPLDDDPPKISNSLGQAPSTLKATPASTSASALIEEKTNGTKKLNKRRPPKENAESPKLAVAEIPAKATAARKRTRSTLAEKAEVPLVESEEEINDSRKLSKRGRQKKDESPIMSEPPKAYGAPKRTYVKLVEPTHVSESEAEEFDDKKSRNRGVPKKKVDSSKLAVAEPPSKASVARMRTRSKLEDSMHAREIEVVEVEEVDDTTKSKKRGAPKKNAESQELAAKEVPVKATVAQRRIRSALAENPEVAPVETEETNESKKVSKRGRPIRVESPNMSEPPKASGIRKRTRANLDEEPTDISEIKVVDVEEVDDKLYSHDTKKSKKRGASKKNMESPKLVVAAAPSGKLKRTRSKLEKQSHNSEIEAEEVEEVHVDKKSRKQGVPKSNTESSKLADAEPPLNASGARKRTRSKLREPTHTPKTDVEEPDDKKSRKRVAPKKQVEIPKLAVTHAPAKASGAQKRTRSTLKEAAEGSTSATALIPEETNDTKKSRQRGVSKKKADSPVVTLAVIPPKASAAQKRTRATSKEVAEASTSAAALAAEEPNDTKKSTKRAVPKKNVETPKVTAAEVSPKASRAQKRTRSALKKVAEAEASASVAPVIAEPNDSKKVIKRGRSKKVESPIMSEPPKASGTRKRTRANLEGPTDVSEIKVVDVEEVDATKKSRKRDAPKKNVESPKVTVTEGPPKAAAVQKRNRSTLKETVSASGSRWVTVEERDDHKNSKKPRREQKRDESPIIGPPKGRALRSANRKP